MTGTAGDPRLPRWRVTHWLIDPGADVPAPVRVALVDNLYGSIPIFIGGVFNTLLISAVIAVTMPTPLFIGWALFELVLAAVRLPVLIVCRRAAREGRPAPTDLYIALAVLWAAGVGFGAFISIWSGNWVVAALASLSSAAMVGGICFRNFAAPRLVGVMILASFGPIAAAGVTSGEPVMLVTGLNIPFYLYAMTVAAFRMNRMMIDTMLAERANATRACQDPLTGLLNRTGLTSAVDMVPNDTSIACFFIDLDGFKRVNDTMGHRAGDVLLAMVAERLRGAADAGAIIARVGGDEFVVVTASAGPEQAAGHGETLAAAVAGRPYIVDSQGIFIGASVGAAMRLDGDLDDMLARADSALYRAKASDQSCIVAGLPDDIGEMDRPRAAPRLARG